MNNYTINTYEMKRDIVNFSKKICEGSSKPETKFTTDMIYGIFKSKNIHLSSIAEALDENFTCHPLLKLLMKTLKKLIQ